MWDVHPRCGMSPWDSPSPSHIRHGLHRAAPAKHLLREQRAEIAVLRDFLMQKCAAPLHFQAGKPMSLCLLPSPVFPSFPPSFDPAPCGSIKRALNILVPVKYLYYNTRKEIGRFQAM